MPTYKSTQAASGRVHKPLIGDPGVITAYAKFTIGTALAADDVIEMLRLPAGATVVGGALRATDIDTGTETLDIDIGWAANGVEAADPDGFGNLGVWTGDSNNDFQLGGVLWTTGPQSFTNETMIQLDVNAAANAGGTGTIWLVIEYVV
jgi:hypothetical protein